MDEDIAGLVEMLENIPLANLTCKIGHLELRQELGKWEKGAER